MRRVLALDLILLFRLSENPLRVIDAQLIPIIEKDPMH